MINLIAGWTADMWGPVINLFNFIPSYAWMIVVFTIALKIVLSPLDFWQRKISRDSMKKQAKLAPELEKINKKYANNNEMKNQQTMALYKRENYNVVGSCFSMLLNMAITMFVFITLWTGLNEISQQKIYDQYANLQQTYYNSYNIDFAEAYNLDITNKTQTEIDTILNNKLNDLIAAQNTNAIAKIRETKGDSSYTPTEDEIYTKSKELAYAETTLANIINTAQTKVLDKYEEIKDSWLWVKNIWRPDTSASGFTDYNTFVSVSSYKSQSFYKNVMDSKDLTDAQKQEQQNKWEEEYNLVTAKVTDNYSGWNGYFILVILAALITYLSTVFSQKQSLKKKQEQNPALGSMKIMTYILPVMMIIFTISYCAAFALYIVINSLMSFLFSILALQIFSKHDDKKEILVKNKNKADYSR